MSKKSQKVTLVSVHNTAEAWLSAGLALVSAIIADMTAPAEGTTPEGKGKPALVVPPMEVFHGWPSSGGFADTRIAEGVRFAKKPGELWEPSSEGIGRARLVDAPVTTKIVEKAEKDNTTVGAIVHGPRLLDANGKQSKVWQLYVSPRLGAGMAAGEGEVARLAVILHYSLMAALGPAPIIQYDPKKQPKAFARNPRGRQERYGERWRTYANMIGFAQPEKKENFDLREPLAAILREAVVGSDRYPEPLGAYPAAVVSGYTLKRIGSSIADFSRQRTFVCPLFDKKDKTTQHTSFIASDRYAPDLVDEETRLVSSVVTDFAPRCGKTDCNKVLSVILPPPLRLYNEAIKRGLPEARALLIASGEIPPPWASEDEKDAAQAAETPADSAAAVGA